MQSELAALAARVALLEQPRPRAPHAAGATLVALALPTLAFLARPAVQDAAPASPPKLDVVRGSEFEMVDDKGKVRARLGFDRGGGPELRLFNASEKVRIRIGIDKDSDPLVTLVDEEDRNRLALAYDGSPHLVLSQPGGKPVVHMTAAPTGAGTLLFTHKDGRHNARFGIHSNGDGFMVAEEQPK